jgi:hypothetical protein
MITPNWYPGEKQLRQFAMICLPAFGMIGYMVYRWSGSQNAGWIVAAFGGACFLAGLARPRAVGPVYFLLISITMPIGWLVSHIILRVIFYGMVTPLGLFFRLIGRDPLQLKKPQTSTFWQEHTQRSDPQSYFRQA